MALVKTKANEITATEAAFQIDPELLKTPSAQRAMLAGLLQAKRQAMHQAEQLLRFGRPLLVAIVFVSFLHVFETIAAIRPDFVTELQLPAPLYHLAAALLTLAIDLAALYVVAASSAAAFVLGRTRRWAVWFFLITTFLLNAAFVVRFAPSLSDDFRNSVLPLLDGSFVILLPAFVPVAIFAVESAVSRLDVARLRLLVEVTALADLVRPSSATTSPEKAMESGKVTSPGRPSYALDDLAPVLALGEFARADVVSLLGCGTSTADRLLSEALDAGRVVKLDKRRYRTA